MTPWRKTLALCVSAAVAQMIAAPVRADSAAGVGEHLGNALNPLTLKTVPEHDPDGLDAWPDERTPTGKLLGWPAKVPETSSAGDGWDYHGQIEIGGMATGGDTENAWFRTYKDLPNSGLYLNNFSVQAEQLGKGKGYFFEALGGGVGYRDQFEGISLGRYNDWSVKFFYNETPHVFTNRYRSLWSGVGSSNLTLNGVPAGGVGVKNADGTMNATASQTATVSGLRNAIEAVEDSELSLVRETGGVSFDKYISSKWRFIGRYSLEHRDGSRPFGAVFGGGGGGGSVEIPESIDYDTHDILAMLRFDDGKNSLNLQTNVSLFRNNIDTLTFENPLYVSTNTVAASSGVLDPTRFTGGRYDLYPDNDFYNIKAEYGRSMPEWYHSRLTATVSLSKMKQNDHLIAPTTSDLSGISINGVSAENNWNTTSALSRQRSGAEIDTRLFDVAFSMRPTDKLGLDTKIRYYETDNKTEYLACNPLTGQWGRLLNDGTGGAFAFPDTTAGNNPAGTLATAYDSAGCNLDAVKALGLVPSSGASNIRNVPYEYSKTNVEFGGEYRLARGQTITGHIEREQYHREYRERDSTWEDMLKIGYLNRAYQWGTIRGSAEVGRRRGDSYDPDPYKEFFSVSLGPEPTADTTNLFSWIHAMKSFRKFDLADRDRLALDLRLDFIARHDLDVGISGQYRQNRFPDSDFGRKDNQTLGTASLDVNWQPSAKLGLYGYYSYQRSSMTQSSIQPNGCVIGNYYYFYSDGAVGSGSTPTAPARSGASLVDTVLVSSGEWSAQCGDHAANSPLWTESRKWTVDYDDTNHAIGLGGRYDLGFARLELDYSYVTGTSSLDYNYNDAALGLSSTIVALAGGGMPDSDYNQHTLGLNLVFPISKSVALRAIYRYEQGSVDDWHYAGVAANPVPTDSGSQAVYLDAGSQDYHDNTLGLLVQVNF
ncbi:MtrB/PioB family outer membrane beta-barrel protein [Thiorhodococcus fuscus]|uniref:MtrB/PioB family outer membrane beta-barrel protein n=1 Tax=Thiorhodococcus fuscus TaxID=527200 RepID=A0ABW4YEE3_9GAMM